VRVDRALRQLLADLDGVPVRDRQTGTERNLVLHHVAGLVRHADTPNMLLVVVLDADHAGQLGDLRHPLRVAGLEQLDHAGEAVRDVLTGDPAGVEGSHGELGARLADRLGGDDAHRLADVDQPARGERTPVARLAHTDVGLAGDDGTNPHGLHAGVDDRRRELVGELCAA
jgi:hypothetical protein